MKASNAASDGLPSMDIKYTYDYTEDGPGIKGAGTLKNKTGKQVFFRGYPGESWGYTLSCDITVLTTTPTGVPEQLQVVAVYTDAGGQEYPGPVARDHGCSTFKMSSHGWLSCCLPATSPAVADISLKHSDCGGLSSHARTPIFGPAAVARGRNTTMVVHGNFDEQQLEHQHDVKGANFELTTTGAHDTILHCTGDASQTKSCPLPMGLGSLTMQGTAFPLKRSPVSPCKDYQCAPYWQWFLPVNIDIYLKETAPKDLLTTTTVVKISNNNAEHGPELFCLKIESTPTASSKAEVVV